MLQKFLDALMGNYNAREVEKLEKLIPLIHQKGEEFQTLSDSQLQDQFAHWKEELTQHPEKVDEYLIPVFAGVQDAARRLLKKTYEVRGKEVAWDMVHFDVQLVGGAVLHQGKIAEMKTGEGKTLVSTLPVVLNALTGKGVHVITVNDYLAQRDAEWMTPLYEFCGLSVGIIVNDKTPEDRQEAYTADITYGTNNEFGFDYLRDNMAQRSESLVQRDLHYAIVDEVDSILIDEARTPLIISAPAEESTDKYHDYAKVCEQLTEGDHYTIDHKSKTATLTEAGVTKVETLMGIQNIFHGSGFEDVHHIEQALKAHATMVADKDYVIRDDKIIIVDEFTGRLMAGRRYSDGLHQALEAKEGVEIQRESKTLATITFQNYFRLYDKLSGMTGTAETEAEEFAKIYKLDVIVVPTNQPLQRADLPDKIYKNEKGKFLSLAKEVQKLHKNGQPVLVGTISIEKSEALSNLLRQVGVPHEVLNAKHHEREAEIIAKAGQKGAITIATNMAGRGTDIKLGEGVTELGGLAVLGTERHESRRIDNQLRGRSGRQGDPGLTQFYVSMTDELMRRFGGERLSAMMERLGIDEEEAIENKMISKSVENAQKKIEGFHFDARKHVVQYDDVMNIHREKIYTRRRKLLSSEEVQEDIEQMIQDLVASIVEESAPSPEPDRTWDISHMAQRINILHQDAEHPITEEELNALSHRDEVTETLNNYILKAWDQKKETLPLDAMDEISKQIMLRSIDELWLEHIDQMTHLRDRVALAGYAQKNPILEYRREGFEMFSQLLQTIRMTAVTNLLRMQVRPNTEFEEADYSNTQTNADQIQDSLENTGEYDGPLPGLPQQNPPTGNQPLSRAERRRQQRKHR